MVDKKGNQGPTTPPSRLDILNRKILELRLKKEQEEEQRRLRNVDKEEKKVARKSLRRSMVNQRLSISFSEPLAKPDGWKVPFKGPESTQFPNTEPPTAAEDLQQPRPGYFQPGQERGLNSTLNDDSDQPGLLSVDQTESIILTSKPGSKNIVKTVQIKQDPEETEVSIPEKRKTDDKSTLGRVFYNEDDGSDTYARDHTLLRNDKPESFRIHERPLAIFSSGHGTSNMQLTIDALSKPKHKINESLLNVLKSGKDEAVQITIIPADEVRILELELEEWKRHRLAFIILFTLAVISGILIMISSVYASLTYYIYKPDGKDAPYSQINIRFVIHSDFMIFGTVLVSSFGILMFRLLPDTKKRMVCYIHSAIFMFICGLFMYGVIIAFDMHDELTKDNTHHLYSLHSILGVLISFFLLWEVISGIYTLIRPGGHIQKYHGAVGMMTFMLCGAGCVSGFLVRFILPKVFKVEKSMEESKRIVTNTTGASIVLFCCLVRYIATEFRFRRRPRPEWDTVFARNIKPEEDDNIDREGCTLQQYVRRNLCIR